MRYRKNLNSQKFFTNGNALKTCPNRILKNKQIFIQVKSLNFCPFSGLTRNEKYFSVINLNKFNRLALLFANIFFSGLPEVTTEDERPRPVTTGSRDAAREKAYLQSRLGGFNHVR